MKILDNYIKQLIENSTPQEPAWNIEKSAPEKRTPGITLTAA